MGLFEPPFKILPGFIGDKHIFCKINFRVLIGILEN